MVIGIAVAMLLTDVKMGLVSLAFVPFMAWRAITTSRTLRKRWMVVQVATGEMVTTIQENLSGMRVVKAFAAEDYEKNKFGVRATAVRPGFRSSHM